MKNARINDNNDWTFFFRRRRNARNPMGIILIDALMMMQVNALGLLSIPSWASILFNFLKLYIRGHLGALRPLSRLTLNQTLSDTFNGSFLPLSLWSINHMPTTNSSLESLPTRLLSTRSQTSASTSFGKRLRRQISRTTRLSTVEFA